MGYSASACFSKMIIFTVRTVHMRSKNVVYRAQIAHAYQRHVSKTLPGRLYVHIAVIS